MHRRVTDIPTTCIIPRERRLEPCVRSRRRIPRTRPQISAFCLVLTHAADGRPPVTIVETERKTHTHLRFHAPERWASSVVQQTYPPHHTTPCRALLLVTLSLLPRPSPSRRRTHCLVYIWAPFSFPFPQRGGRSSAIYAPPLRGELADPVSCNR